MTFVSAQHLTFAFAASRSLAFPRVFRPFVCLLDLGALADRSPCMRVGNRRWRLTPDRSLATGWRAVSPNSQCFFASETASFGGRFPYVFAQYDMAVESEVFHMTRPKTVRLGTRRLLSVSRRVLLLLGSFQVFFR